MGVSGSRQAFGPFLLDAGERLLPRDLQPAPLVPAIVSERSRWDDEPPGAGPFDARPEGRFGPNSRHEDREST